MSDNSGRAIVREMFLYLRKHDSDIHDSAVLNDCVAKFGQRISTKATPGDKPDRAIETLKRQNAILAKELSRDAANIEHHLSENKKLKARVQHLETELDEVQRSFSSLQRSMSALAGEKAEAVRKAEDASESALEARRKGAALDKVRAYVLMQALSRAQYSRKRQQLQRAFRRLNFRQVAAIAPNQEPTAHRLLRKVLLKARWRFLAHYLRLWRQAAFRPWGGSGRRAAELHLRLLYCLKQRLCVQAALQHWVQGNRDFKVLGRLLEHHRRHALRGAWGRWRRQARRLMLRQAEERRQQQVGAVARLVMSRYSCRERSVFESTLSRCWRRWRRLVGCQRAVRGQQALRRRRLAHRCLRMLALHAARRLKQKQVLEYSMLCFPRCLAFRVYFCQHVWMPNGSPVRG